MEIIGYTVGQIEDAGYASFTSPLRTMTLEDAKVIVRSKEIEYPNLSVQQPWQIFEVRLAEKEAAQ